MLKMKVIVYSSDFVVVAVVVVVVAFVYLFF